jgi:hypothetical protein
MGDGARIGAASKRNDLVAIEISRVAPEPDDMSPKNIITESICYELDVVGTRTTIHPI